MKMLACTEYGPIENLTIKDISTPIPKKNEVLIEVKACGMNFPDVLIVQGLYQFRPEFPFAPGGEIAGVITQIGAKVSNFKVGDKVVALTGWGGCAEAVVTTTDRIFHLPDGIEWSVAATAFYTYGTMFHALKDRANLQKGEKVLILGASGGIGTAAIDLAKWLGAEVIAAASTQEKLQVCQEKGADHLINYVEEDLKKAVKKLYPQGIDVVVDPVGGDYTETALRTLGWNGRHLIIGFTAGNIPKIPMNLPLLKGCKIVGVFWGSFAARFPERYRAETSELIELLQNKSIQPHIQHTYTLENAQQAIKDLQNRKAVGKIVVIP